MKYLHLLLSLGFLILGVSCTSDQSIQSEQFEVRMRLPEEPARLNPLLSTNAYETQLLNMIFLPLAEFNPYSLEYQPVLVESISDREVLNGEDPFAGEVIYDFRIKDDATWHDGKPVVAADYAFTAKTVFVPQLSSSAWLGYLINILDIRLDPDDPKRFQVVVEKEYMLALEAITNFQIFPQHHYDPQGLLSNYSFNDLRYAEDQGTDLTQDTVLAQFADQFSAERFSRTNILGCGPYQLDEWVTGQYISLKKVDNWWGNKYSEASELFMANPDRIIYPIIADETVALTSLKDKQIDALTINNPSAFVEIKEDPLYEDQFHFLMAPIPVYYYIALNNQSPLLDDPKVRKAVAKTLPVEQLITDLMQGTAQRTVGPIHSGKSYYNQAITPVDFDIEGAKRLLKEAGWEDSNDNGVVDKNIDGELNELVLRFFVTQQQLGRRTALTHKEAAAQAGIEIDIVTEPDFPTIRKDHLMNGDFEMVAAASRMSPSDYDPYQNWHSDNYSTGSNYYGYADSATDELIEEIRDEEDPTERAELYLEFQQQLHDQQAAIFLFSPMNLIIVNKDFDAKAAERRPGFFESHLKPSP